MKKQAIMLFHGLWSTPTEFGFMVKLLKAKGFDVLTPQARTYGQCDDGPLTTTYHDWINEVRDLYLNAKKEYETVYVSGLCIGSSLALALAALPDFDSENDMIFSLSATMHFDGWDIPFAGEYLFKGFYFFHRYFNLMPNWRYVEDAPYGIKDPKMQRLIRMSFRNMTKSEEDSYATPARYVHQALKLGKYLKKNLQKITAPLLICHAKEDETASPRNACIIENLVSSAISRKVLLKNSYHMITLDSERERLAHEISHFIAFVNEMRSSRDVKQKQEANRNQLAA
ncbi:MAG: alpha/beta fold hydrolase [Alphaproteobacteria bacterium]|jgi:carboxylesterase|nr:alpha/beta fold hydrolase [Alphaproteobacteria bacterium]